jgi:hypothetical protein
MSPSGYSDDMGLSGEKGECNVGCSLSGSIPSGRRARRGGNRNDYPTSLEQQLNRWQPRLTYPSCRLDLESVGLALLKRAPRPCASINIREVLGQNLGLFALDGRYLRSEEDALVPELCA